MSTSALEAAGGKLFDEVYVPAFIQACAQRGVAIKSAEDLQLALESTQRIQDHLQKEAADSSSELHKAANLALRRLAGEDPEATEKAAAQDQFVSSLSSQLADGDGVAEAAALLAKAQNGE